MEDYVTSKPWAFVNEDEKSPNDRVHFSELHYLHRGDDQKIPIHAGKTMIQFALLPMIQISI